MSSRGTGAARIDAIADCEFTGPRVPGRIATYASLTQKLAHDLARELAEAEPAALAAMRQLGGHPLLAGVDVRLRARKVARVLREARELAMAVSGEAVAFNAQFRAEFGEILVPKRDTKPANYQGKVQL